MFYVLAEDSRARVKGVGLKFRVHGFEFGVEGGGLRVEG